MSRPAEECILRGVFDLVEEGAPDELPPCGRCPSCRAHGRRPPHAIACHGLETVWPYPTESRRSALPSGVILIAPSDPTYETGFERLVQRLVASGVEQFVVPDFLTAQTARTLADSSASFGFIISHNELLGEAAAKLASLPTVFFLPVQDAAAAALMLHLRHWRGKVRLLSIAIVAQPERTLNSGGSTKRCPPSLLFLRSFWMLWLPRRCSHEFVVVSKAPPKEFGL